MRIIAGDRGFIYQGDGRGLRDKSDFEALMKLGDPGWDRSVEAVQNPMRLGVHVLLAHEEVESAPVPVSNNWQRLPIIREASAGRRLLANSLNKEFMRFIPPNLKSLLG